MPTRMERLRKTVGTFTHEQYDEFSPKEVKRIGKFLERKGPGLKNTYERRRERGRQRVTNFLGGVKTKVKGPVQRKVKGPDKRRKK